MIIDRYPHRDGVNTSAEQVCNLYSSFWLSDQEREGGGAHQQETGPDWCRKVEPLEQVLEKKSKLWVREEGGANISRRLGVFLSAISGVYQH